MAERRSKALLEEEDLDQELEFKDTFPGFSDAPVLDSEEESKLLPTEEQTKPVSFWEFKYYQKMFDVDTNQVLQRIVWSVIPRPSRATYLHRFIRPNPDLYGPFWICATLVFTIAVSNNIADYLQSIGRIKSEIYYDYRKVSFTATTLYSYVFLMPLAVWGMLWYFQSTAEYRLLEIICIYGYSLAVYIPISVLWIIKSFWFQIAIIIVGFVLSSAVMMLTFWPAISETRKKISSIILMVILLFHLLLAFGFASHHLNFPVQIRWKYVMQIAKNWEKIEEYARMAISVYGWQSVHGWQCTDGICTDGNQCHGWQSVFCFNNEVFFLPEKYFIIETKVKEKREVEFSD